MSTINENTTINGTLTVSNDMTAKKDLHVRGWLYAANVANIYKGSFPTIKELNERWPAASCEDGWVAGVGKQDNGLIAYVFSASAGAWRNTNAKLYVDTNTDIAELQSGKVDKVGSATAGKIALLKSDGGITQQNSKSLSELANTNHSHGIIDSNGTIDTSRATAIHGGDKMIVLQDGKTIVGREVVFDGRDTSKALTKAGTFETFLTSHQDISGKADKVSSPTNNNLVSMNGSGDLTNSGKKASDFENVINKVTSFSYPTHTQYPSARLTYFTIIARLGAAVCETLQCTFALTLASNDYFFTDFYKGVISELLLVVINGEGYDPNGNVHLLSGSVNMGFVFKDPYSIPDGAFEKMTNLKVVHIPSYVKVIGSNTFKGCTGLRKIECECMTPPKIESDTFNGVEVANKKVFVHKVAGSLYQASNDWNQFVLVDMNGTSL